MVSAVLDCVAAAGMTEAEILADYPTLDVDEIRASRHTAPNSPETSTPPSSPVKDRARREPARPGRRDCRCSRPRRGHSGRRGPWRRRRRHHLRGRGTCRAPRPDPGPRVRGRSSLPTRHTRRHPRVCASRIVGTRRRRNRRSSARCRRPGWPQWVRRRVLRREPAHPATILSQRLDQVEGADPSRTRVAQGERRRTIDLSLQGIPGTQRTSLDGRDHVTTMGHRIDAGLANHVAHLVALVMRPPGTGGGRHSCHAASRPPLKSIGHVVPSPASMMATIRSRLRSGSVVGPSKPRLITRPSE